MDQNNLARNPYFLRYDVSGKNIARTDNLVGGGEGGVLRILNCFFRLIMASVITLLATRFCEHHLLHVTIYLHFIMILLMPFQIPILYGIIAILCPLILWVFHFEPK